jgi:formylmethanofuran dehydrogenase subunit E-like metal-binding protein
MKQTSIQTIAKRFFLGNLLAAALFLSANAATVSTANVASDKVEVKYTGVDKYNQLSFNVKYSNPTGNTFNLTVLDENGESIFKGFYGDKQFDKTFKLPKSEVSKLTFLIEDGKESFKQRFEVNIKTQVIEDVVVSKS